jgi:hypothetical protein
MNYVSARVVGNTKNIYIPVHNGAKVALGTKEDIQTALGLNEIKNRSFVVISKCYSGVEEAKIELASVCEFGLSRWARGGAPEHLWHFRACDKDVIRDVPPECPATEDARGG